MIDIDKYLQWYEPKTIELLTIDIKQSKLNHIQKMIGLMMFRVIQNPANTTTQKLIEIYQPKVKALENEINEISQVVQLHYYTVNNKAMPIAYYIPTLEDWQFLHSSRNNFLEHEKSDFLEIANFASSEMIQAKATEFKEWITEYIHLYHIEKINPLPYGAKLFDFINLVHYFDCYNYYIGLLPATENKETSTLPLLQWNITDNTLSTFFFDLLQANIITYTGKTEQGAKMQIAKMINQYFLNSNGKNFSIASITDTLDPSKPKAKKRIDIKNIIPPPPKIKKT